MVFCSTMHLKPRRKRSKKLVLFYLFILFAVGFTVTSYLRFIYGDFLHDLPLVVAVDILKIPDDVTCYRQDYGTPDVLKDVPKHAIFLIATSCESGLSLHQACAIEAVTRTHIDRKIFILLNRPIKDCPCSEGLQAGLESIPTVHFVRIQINQFVKNTPLDGIFDDSFLDVGLRKHKRVTEILKFVTLLKYGGVVIDLDMIMAKPVTFLGSNWAVKVNSSMLGSAIISIDKGSVLGKKLMPLILSNLKEQRYNKEINGGQALTDAFKKLCYDSPAEGCSGGVPGTLGTPTCSGLIYMWTTDPPVPPPVGPKEKGPRSSCICGMPRVQDVRMSLEFKIHDTKYFYPINESSKHMYFQKGHLLPIAYGYNIWDPRHIVRRRGSVYFRLMKEYCPNVMSYL